jgi:hypothetical protein
MSNYDFVIGPSPIPEEATCKLQFHQYTIYDSENWTQSGQLYWNAATKNFEVIPNPTQQKTGLYKPPTTN